MVCESCGKERLASDFSKRFSECKKCRHSAVQKRWAQRNKDYIQTKHKEIRKKYDKTPKGRAASGRKNSKRRYMIANRAVSEDVLQREKQFRLSMTKCANCKTTERLSLDHIVPLSKGGVHDLDNWQCLCVPCNSRKRDCLL